jgi:hypothetical protein
MHPAEAAMRLFEALLVAIAGQLLFAALVLGLHRPRKANLLSLAALAPLAAHVVLEGVRWQMAPAYAAALGLCVAGVIRYARPVAQGSGAVISRLFAGVGLLLLIASVVAATLTRGA